MIGSLTRSAITAAIGYALGAALFWALLNVPESNVLALALSAALVVLITIAAGTTTAMATAFTQNVSSSVAMRRAWRALPNFIAGLAIFAVLWWLSGWADTWWTSHRGEADAIFLRYLGITRTQPFHLAVAWLLWFVRWVLGLSVVVGLTATGTHRGMRASGSGLRLSLRLVPLAAATIAALIVSQGLWTLLFWRPKSIPPTWLEPAFAGVKLAFLYAVTMAIAAAVLRTYACTADRL